MEENLIWHHSEFLT